MADVPALLLIDIQCGYFAGPRQLFQSDRFLGVVSELLRKARAGDVPVVYTRYLGEPGNPTEVGTPGGEIYPHIAPEPSDWVVGKRSTDCFHQSGLHKLLDSLGADHLYIAGCISELCVDTTCRSAISLGYRTTLVADGHATINARLMGVSPYQRTKLMNFVLSRVGTADRMINVQPADQIGFAAAR